MERRRECSGTCFGLAPHSIISVSLCTLMTLGVFMGTTIERCRRLAACTQEAWLEPLPLAGGCHLLRSSHSKGREKSSFLRSLS